MKETLKMALEALCVAVEPKKGKVYAREFEPIDCFAMHEQAITAIKAALAQTEQELAIGDVRALKHRIHELEGELLGYKEILDEQSLREPDAVATLTEDGWTWDGDQWQRPPELNQFNPDWDAMAVMVEEQQRMAKRIEELETMLERQTARIVDLQTHIENFDGEDR